MLNGKTEEEKTETLPEWCARVGLTITCVPNNVPPPWGDTIMDGWMCTLALEGRSLATPFWQGIGHREWSPMERLRDGSKGASVQSQDYSSKYTRANGWQHVKSYKELPSHISPTLHNVAAAMYRAVPPDAASVLATLLSDASGVAHGQSFEDWCAELGYDTDSRKAEQSFKECQAIALKLHGLLGSLYEDAQTAAQDY